MFLILGKIQGDLHVRHNLAPSHFPNDYMLLYFKHVGEPEYMLNQTFSAGLPVIRDSKDYTLYGNGACDQRLESYEFMYLDYLEKTLS